MASTQFVSKTTPIVTPWLNDVNTIVYGSLGTSSGTNTISVGAPVSMTGYAVGQRFVFTPLNTTTAAAVTLNIGGFGALAVKRIMNGLINLGIGDLAAGCPAEVYYDGVQFILINPSSGLGPTFVDQTSANTGTTTLVATQANSWIYVIGSGAQVVLPATSTMQKGQSFTIVVLSTVSGCSIKGNGAETIAGGLATNNVYNLSAGETVTVTCYTVGFWFVTMSSIMTQLWYTPFTTNPTVTAGSGTFTSVSASIRTRQIAKMVFFNLVVTITTNGSAAGSVNIASMPFVTGGAIQVVTGREAGVSGAAITGTMNANSSALTIVKYDNSYPGATGATLVLTGSMETQ